VIAIGEGLRQPRACVRVRQHGIELVPMAAGGGGAGEGHGRSLLMRVFGGDLQDAAARQTEKRPHTCSRDPSRPCDQWRFVGLGLGAPCMGHA